MDAPAANAPTGAKKKGSLKMIHPRENEISAAHAPKRLVAMIRQRDFLQFGIVQRVNIPAILSARVADCSRWWSAAAVGACLLLSPTVEKVEDRKLHGSSQRQPSFHWPQFLVKMQNEKFDVTQRPTLTSTTLPHCCITRHHRRARVLPRSVWRALIPKPLLLPTAVRGGKSKK